MTMTARQPSLQQLKAAAVKKWGKQAYVDYRPNLPDAEKRHEWNALNEAAGNRIKEIEAELKSLGPMTILREFAKAAEFVVDVNGDYPSIDGLHPVLARYARRVELTDEQAKLTEEKKNRPCYSKRWKAGKVSSVAGFGMAHVYAEADTAAELMDMINASTR